MLTAGLVCIGVAAVVIVGVVVGYKKGWLTK